MNLHPLKQHSEYVINTLTALPTYRKDKRRKKNVSGGDKI